MYITSRTLRIYIYIYTILCNTMYLQRKNGKMGKRYRTAKQPRARGRTMCVCAYDVQKSKYIYYIFNGNTHWSVHALTLWHKSPNEMNILWEMVYVTGEIIHCVLCFTTAKNDRATTTTTYKHSNYMKTMRQANFTEWIEAKLRHLRINNGFPSWPRINEKSISALFPIHSWVEILLLNF